MARVDLPQSNLRRRRRRRRVFLLFSIAALAVVVLLGTAWLARASFVRIASIEIIGAETMPAGTIKAFVEKRLEGSYFGLFPRNSIFLYPKKNIESDLLRDYPELHRADVHAVDFQSIAVELGERHPVALWCREGGSCSLMDENGVIYAPAPTFSEPVYIEYSGPSGTTTHPELLQYLGPDQFQSLAALASALGDKITDDPVRRVSVDDARDVRVELSSGFRLTFALSQDAGDIFERFSLALESEPFKGKKLSDFEYLDLRFGDKLYYREK